MLDRLLPAILPRVQNSNDYFVKTRHAVFTLRRPIRPAEEGLQVRCEKNRHRPATSTGHHLYGLHVDLIEIRTFFAIDFDADKVLIESRGDRVAFETFVLHHVAPMTCRIANRKEDRFLLILRSSQCFVRPRMPVNRIVFVLQEVGARFVSETVGHGMLS